MNSPKLSSVGLTYVPAEAITDTQPVLLTAEAGEGQTSYRSGESGSTGWKARLLPLLLSSLCRVRHQFRPEAAERAALKLSREITGDRETKASPDNPSGSQHRTKQRDKGQTASLKAKQF